MYSPTVKWISICFLLIVAEIIKLDTRAIDCVFTFPQAELDVPIYTELPAGMELEDCKNSDSVLSLKVCYMV